MTTIETIPDLTKIEYSSFVFSGGELQVRITNPTSVSTANAIKIHADLVNSNAIFELAFLTDAIRRININPFVPIHLECPYFPAARQDRVMEFGESLSVKVMCDFINSLNFASVTVWDAHSDVTLALLNRVTNIGPERFLDSVLTPNMQKFYCVVSPDAGAMKKVAKVAKKFGVPMITASKIRDTNTGAITGTEIHIPNELIGHKFLIVDDICDGGKTFIELAKAIRLAIHGDNSIELYVTHGIFSKGLDVLVDAGISTIYTANRFPNVEKDNPYLNIVKKG